MAEQKAGLGAAIAVLLAVLGLMTLVGVILLMMWFEPGIEHSPSQTLGFRSLPAASQFRPRQTIAQSIWEVQA